LIHLPRRAMSLVATIALAAGIVGCAAPVGVAPTTDARGCPTAQPAALDAGQTRTVDIATSKGTITIKVEADLAPIATGNFVALASCGFYNGLTFHRVVPGFVIQGGDPNGNGSGGPGYTIADDPVTSTYHRGTVAMARTPAPHSQGSQFFIVLSDDAASSLASANTYAILGEVTAGMDVVDAITADADAELPSHPIAMTTVTVRKETP
jgi:cyclophilin family peptidyl-prolyl cis-trans isomerase